MHFCTKIALTLLCLLGFQLSLEAQQVVNFPENRDGNIKLESLLNGSDVAYHTGFKPLMRQRVAATEFKYFDKDSSLQYYWITQKMFKENMVKVDEERFYITADPIFNFEFGTDFRDTSISAQFKNSYAINNTRGFIVEGMILNKIAFSSSFYENQNIPVDYIYDYAAEFNVMPGQGRVKPYKALAGWDYAMSSAYLSYSPSSKVNMQFGHQKNFVGEGYRSLLLSDNTFNYPGLKVSFLFGENDAFQYTGIMASMQSLQRFSTFTTPEALFKRKMGSFYYLSWNATPTLQLGLFEGMVWRRVNEDEELVMDGKYYIPVLGAGTALNGFSGENNAVVGLNAKFRPTPKTQLYGQLMVDDPSKNQFGYQVGAKFYNIRDKEGFTVQLEFNKVTPYAYSHADPLQSFSHYNQALAHPLGAAFNELLGILNFDIPGSRFFTRCQVNIAAYDEDDENNNSGRDIFRSLDDQQNVIVGTKTNLVYTDAHIGFSMLKATNLQWVAGFSFRQLSTADNSHTTSYLYVGIRTNLINRYYDF
jgi:hypothetical protein